MSKSMNVKKKLAALLPYTLVLAGEFYLLPLLMRGTGMAMLLMLCVMPLTTLICGGICGVRQGFGILLPLVVMALFAPTVFIYYNVTAWVYIPVYGAIVLAGLGVGRIFYRKK